MRLYRSSVDNRFVIIAHEPISGSVFKLEGEDEGFATFPKLSEMQLSRDLMQRRFHSFEEDLASQRDNLRPMLGELFTEFETPYENLAIFTMLSRLRFLKTHENIDESSLFFAEDPKLVETLKAALDAANLPFFFTINDLCLNFEVDEAAARAKGCIKKLVFGVIRGNKVLSQFLCQVTCNLRVLLNTYNGTEKEAMEWSDLVAHVTDYCNPFVSVQLLPTTLSPVEYEFKPHEDPVIDPTSEPEGDVTIRRGPADYDGGSFPNWDGVTPFSFRFKPPKLSSCKMVSTAVACVSIDNTTTYAVIFIREDRKEVITPDKKSERQKFFFLTIYDPRSATEYQCGVDAKKMSEEEKRFAHT